MRSKKKSNKKVKEDTIAKLNDKKEFSLKFPKKKNDAKKGLGRSYSMQKNLVPTLSSIFPSVVPNWLRLSISL